MSGVAVLKTVRDGIRDTLRIREVENLYPFYIFLLFLFENDTSKWVWAATFFFLLSCAAVGDAYADLRQGLIERQKPVCIFLLITFVLLLSAVIQTGAPKIDGFFAFVFGTFVSGYQYFARLRKLTGSG